MSEVAIVENTALTEAEALPPVHQDAGAIMSLIERAARDPDVDINKMERLFEMHERMLERQARLEFDEALSQMQAELPAIGKSGSATNKEDKLLYKYAKWDDMNLAIRPFLQKYKFSLNFRIEPNDTGLLITGVLSRGGHSIETSIPQTLESASAAMNANQARGNATSYGKRYTAAALLNLITTDEEDTDGDQGPGLPVSDEQAARLSELLATLDRDESTFIAYLQSQGCKAVSIQTIPEAWFEGTEKKLLGFLEKVEEAEGAGK